jgi:gamma-glutamylcyclotransferase (GGCT)/AIG2-like uncharacterized protein YtfP
VRFFFYGTLIAGSGNAVAERIHPRLLPLGPAIVPGRLFAIPHERGWYPALLHDPGDESEVHGGVYETLPAFTADDLALLDRYEGFDPARPYGSEYLRRQIDMICRGREEPADAYLYQAALPDGARPVPHGDFRLFLSDTGLPAYREG